MAQSHERGGRGGEHHRPLRRFRRRTVHDLRALDSRGRLGQPPRPVFLASFIFSLVALLGATTYLMGREHREPPVLMLVAAIAVFGIAVAAGWALAIAEYRAAQQTDRAAAELLTLHAELDRERRTIRSRIHDARAVTAAMGAALHALERSGGDPVITSALSDQLAQLRDMLTSTPAAGLEALALADVLVQASPFATLHGMTLLHEAPDDAVVLANRDQLFQILQNLIDNARKYAPGSPVLITCEPAGPFLKIAVQDEGPGLTPGEAEQAFLPGVRRGDTQGYGMGLAIARSLAEGMQGALWYEPRAGRGARFVLKLRRATGDAPADGEQAP